MPPLRTSARRRAEASREETFAQHILFASRQSPTSAPRGAKAKPSVAHFRPTRDGSNTPVGGVAANYERMEHTLPAGNHLFKSKIVNRKSKMDELFLIVFLESKVEKSPSLPPIYGSHTLRPAPRSHIWPIELPKISLFCLIFNGEVERPGALSLLPRFPY